MLRIVHSIAFFPKAEDILPLLGGNSPPALHALLGEQGQLGQDSTVVKSMGLGIRWDWI